MQPVTKEIKEISSPVKKTSRSTNWKTKLSECQVANKKTETKLTNVLREEERK